MDRTTDHPSLFLYHLCSAYSVQGIISLNYNYGVCQSDVHSGYQYGLHFASNLPYPHYKAIEIQVQLAVSH